MNELTGFIFYMLLYRIYLDASDRKKTEHKINKYMEIAKQYFDELEKQSRAVIRKRVLIVTEDRDLIVDLRKRYAIICDYCV